MGCLFRLAVIVVLSAAAVPSPLSVRLARAAPGPDCGPQFDRLTADNVIPSYRRVLETRETRSAFHHSIPADYKLFYSSEAAIGQIYDCYRRVEALLAPRAEAGNVEAQFVLGHLLLYAYNPLLGGYMVLNEESEEARKRGHRWLVEADKAGHFDAAAALVTYYSMQLDLSTVLHRAGALSPDPPLPWLPAPKDMLEWLERAATRGHLLAYFKISTHYFQRFTYARFHDPAEGGHYRELSEHYRRLGEQARRAGESPGGGAVRP